MNHTPGPWTLQDPRPTPFDMIQTQNGEQIVELTHWAAEINANARLIAAAPDLLAACNAVTEIAQRVNDIQHAGQTVWPELWSELYQATAAAKGAIARAEGRAS